MQPKLWVILALMASAGLSPLPAYAQFAAEDSAKLPATGDGAYDEAAYDQADAAAPYGTAPSQSIGDRSVAEVATSVLGIKGAQRVQDAETIVRTVIGKAGGNGGTPGSPGADPAGLAQDILTAARKTKDPQ
ncbi:hypothetical protein [Sphingopyxis sp.]|uniref:hypothetical protein n=1 Tax=Sphingopyxis sp. TaxID=1908224 RepID=UPI003BA8E14C